MAILQTPELLPINAFDPSFNHNVEFLYDGNQVVKNRLIITDNSTGNVVYDKSQSGMRLFHTIPENILSCGKQYTAQIQVFDADGNASNLSEQTLFYCYSTPMFAISGVSKDEIVHKAELTISLIYYQSENETLKEHQFIIYNDDGSIKETSEILYSNTSMSYVFRNLLTERSYSVRVVGKTTHGMDVDTGLVNFNVQYVLIPANIAFEVKNNCKQGYITLFSGVIDIGYELENNNYVFENGMVTLTNNSVTYNKGFSIDADFILHVEAKKLPLDKAFLKLNIDNISLCIMNICGSFYCCIDNQYGISQFAELPKARLATENNQLISAEDGNIIQIVNADYEDDDLVVFEIVRENGIYGLSAYYKSDVYKINN